MLTKYPPIEGGVSAGNYWLARGLGEQGVSVTVVTNALCVEDVYRIPMDVKDPAVKKEWQPTNVEVSSLEEKMPTHIPYSPAYSSRLVNLALAEMGDHTFDAMYTHYLEPYGTAALLVKHLTGMPFVLRHAGSDIYRLFLHHDLRYVLGRVISSADKIILSPQLRHLMPAMGVKEHSLWRIRRSIHPSFSPEGGSFDFSRWGIEVPSGMPVILYLGKAGGHKSLLESVEALAQIPLDFRYFIVTQGSLVPELRERIGKLGMSEKIFTRPFVAPWEVPSLLRSASALLHLENKFPIPIHGPTQPFEAVACGTPLVLSGEMYEKISRVYPEKESFTIIENPDDIPSLRAGLMGVIKNVEEKKAKALLLCHDQRGTQPWEEHIGNYIKLFEELSRMKK